ncbi:hypothetical protein JEQ12_005009 [Ovis aries]|uniref:Chemokine interleukin-8-like domain-containing protein n=1 Tax=Ovis aries TaxID=9940 RepID=A0A835ZT77_SHEEP|nr:hypothetical protein JEQ12_005009 [Ovis aries]
MTQKIPVSRLVGYQRNRESCSDGAVILKTVKGKSFCADPKEEWVQKAMKQLDQKAAVTQKSGTFERQIESDAPASPASQELLVRLPHIYENLDNGKYNPLEGEREAQFLSPKSHVNSDDGQHHWIPGRHVKVRKEEEMVRHLFSRRAASDGDNKTDNQQLLRTGSKDKQSQTAYLGSIEETDH